MKLEKIKIEPASVRPDGKFFFDLNKMPLPDGFEIKGRDLVFIPAGAFGGNHKHKRIECFFTIGEGMTFIWQDESGTIHEEEMNPQGEYYLFIVHPYLPHAIINKGKVQATLMEYADGPLENVEYIDLIKNDE